MKLVTTDTATTKIIYANDFVFPNGPVDADIYNYGTFTNGGIDDDYITLLIGDSSNSNYLFVYSTYLT